MTADRLTLKLRRNLINEARRTLGRKHKIDARRYQPKIDFVSDASANVRFTAGKAGTVYTVSGICFDPATGRIDRTKQQGG